MTKLIWLGVLNIMAHLCAGKTICHYKAANLSSINNLVTFSCDVLVYISGYIAPDKTLGYDFNNDAAVSKSFQIYNCKKASVPIYWGVDICSGRTKFDTKLELDVYKTILNRAFEDAVKQKYYGLWIQLCVPSNETEKTLLENITRHFTALKSPNQELGLAVSYLGGDDFPFNMSNFQNALEWIEIGGVRNPVSLNDTISFMTQSYDVMYYYNKFLPFGIPPSKYVFSISLYTYVYANSLNMGEKMPYGQYCTGTQFIYHILELLANAANATYPAKPSIFLAPLSAVATYYAINNVTSLNLGGISVHALDHDDVEKNCTFVFTNFVAEGNQQSNLSG